jgi:hypothetical protein
MKRRCFEKLALVLLASSLSTSVFALDLVQISPKREPLKYSPARTLLVQMQCTTGGPYCGGVCCSRGQVCCGPSPTSRYCASKCD